MPTAKKDIIQQRYGLQNHKRYKGGKPDLRVTERTKYKNDMSYTKDVMDFFIESSWFQDQTTVNSGNYRDLYIMYDAYNTFIPEEYFHYVTNPLNSSKTDRANFPARIRPYSIIRPNIDLLLGEFDKRPYNYTVVALNADVVSQVEQDIYQSVVASLEQQFINKLNEQGYPTGQESKEVEPPAEIKARKLGNFKDARAEKGQRVLNRLYHELKLEEEWRRCQKDWLIAGECYTDRGVEEDGDVYYERISPLDFDYDKSPDFQFVEDGAWAVRRKYMSPSDVVSKFWKELKPYEIDGMEQEDSSLPFTSTYYNTLFGNTYRTEEDLRRTKIPAYQVRWKYYKKVGILTYVDEFGQLQEAEVPEGYKKQSDQEIVDWYWVPEVWEGWRIDSSITSETVGERSDVYLGVKPLNVQRGQINNMASCKLPFNGLRFSDVHSRNISLVELGMPYQILYQILHYRMELAIAKSKGRIGLLDINTIPNKKGWDTEKFLYYAEALGFGLIDRNQEGSDKTWNQYQTLDLSQVDQIQFLIKAMEQVKMEWDQLLGITPQRKGNVAASETATGTQAARYQSAIISERLFVRFGEFLDRERQALLDYSKFSNIASDKTPFYNDDLSLALDQVSQEDYMEAEFGVYASSDAKDMQDLETLKQIIPNMSSQGLSPSTMIEMIQSRNISTLKSILNEMEVKQMEAAAKQQESQDKLEQRKMAVTKELEAIKFEFENMLQNNKYDREESLAHIDGQYKLADTNTAGDINTISPVDIEKNMLQREKIQGDQNLQREKMFHDKEIKQMDVDAKKHTDETNLKIAKENKTQHELKADGKE